jgi:hypothetical protein
VKLWLALVVQDVQPGENNCGIETGVRTAGREILFGCLLEMRIGVLMFLCQAVFSQIPHC